MSPDMPPRLVRCRYLRLTGNQCTGEAVQQDADILLCTKHLARVMVMLRGASR